MVLTGRDIQWYIEKGKLVIQPIRDDQFQQNGVDLILRNFEPVNSKTGFFLGETVEWIEMPDDLMAFVEIRSTWARKGFFLPPTIVDAGFKGSLTLEILHIGVGSAAEAITERFAHLIFVRTTGPCEPYNGKYQNQQGIIHAR